ncbi:PilZ domain-containing protein [Xanthobacter sp. NFH-44]|uniref:PilZ domain-containing protein n=1 Tax=unclassified Xanthobacter TaxID=2623496 RepID=UPI00351D0BC0
MLVITERRTTRRRRTLLTGKIILNQRSSVISCVVRNLSDTGACLEVPAALNLPDAFELKIEPGGACSQCRIVWRSATRIGVAFD